MRGASGFQRATKHVTEISDADGPFDGIRGRVQLVRFVFLFNFAPVSAASNTAHARRARGQFYPGTWRFTVTRSLRTLNTEVAK